MARISGRSPLRSVLLQKGKTKKLVLGKGTHSVGHKMNHSIEEYTKDKCSVFFPLGFRVFDFCLIDKTSQA